MKTLWWSLAVIAGCLVSSGCVASRTTEKLWSAGEVEYYADFSEMEGRTIYEQNGDYFIKLKLAAYRPDPQLLGIIAPLSHFVVFKHPVEGKWDSVWCKLSGEAKEELCTALKPLQNEEDQEEDHFSLNVEPVWKMTQKPANAVTHPIVRELPPPEVIRFCCGDTVSNSQLLATRKHWSSYFLVPLMPVALTWDLSATIVMSVYCDLVLVPNLFLAKAGKSLLGFGD